MYANEMRELAVDELEQKLSDAYQELFNLRFQQKVGQLKDFNRVKTVKREIARLKTVAREKGVSL